MRDLEPSIILLLAEHRTMTAEEIAEALGSDVQSVNATLQQMKHSQWVIDTESFLATLKKELVHRRVFTTRAEARLAIHHWIEAWYNRRRLHSRLGYQSPIEWEDHYRED